MGMPMSVGVSDRAHWPIFAPPAAAPTHRFGLESPISGPASVPRYCSGLARAGPVRVFCPLRIPRSPHQDGPDDPGSRRRRWLPGLHAHQHRMGVAHFCRRRRCDRTPAWRRAYARRPQAGTRHRQNAGNRWRDSGRCTRLPQASVPHDRHDRHSSRCCGVSHLDFHQQDANPRTEWNGHQDWWRAGHDVPAVGHLPHCGVPRWRSLLCDDRLLRYVACRAWQRPHRSCCTP